MWTRSSRAVMLVIACLISFSDVAAQEERGLRQLTDDSAQDGFPSCSPDGRYILFSRYGRDVAPERTGLWLVSPDGGEPHQLTTVIGEHPDWSPAGGNRVQITSHPSYDDGPSWSPDGTRIAFVSTRSGNFDIWTVEVDVEQVRRELVKLGQ